MNTGKPNRLFRSFKKYLGFYFILAGIFAAVGNLLQFAGPIAIRKIL